MNENRKKHCAALAATVIKGLESRNMSACYAETCEDAVKAALAMIPEGSTVTMGGGQSIIDCGLFDALQSDKYQFIDRNKAEDRRAAMLQAYDADVYLASANAISADGVMVNIDGNANRVSAIAYGPKKVIFIVGMNKIAPDLDSAMKRARNTAAPVNCQRLNLNTPCVKTGKCMDCKSPDTICCEFLITRYSKHPGRINVILVGEELGF